jgi:hypothetical protein
VSSAIQNKPLWPVQGRVAKVAVEVAANVTAMVAVKVAAKVATPGRHAGRYSALQSAVLSPVKPLCMAAGFAPKSALRQSRFCGLENAGFPIPSLPAKDPPRTWY